MLYRISAFFVCVAAASWGHAASIPVGDHSFESAAPNPGDWSNGPHGDGTGIGSWTEDNDGSNGSFVENISGFAAEGTRHIGINALTTSLNAGIVPEGTFQYNVFQDVGVGLMPNTEYTLTVGVGRRNAGFNPAGGLAAYGVEVNGTSLVTGTYDASPLPDATFVDQTATFTTGETVPAGNITIKLSNIDVGLAQNTAAIGARSHFDNVRLDAEPVPEPVGLGMLTALGLGIIALRRRRR